MPEARPSGSAVRLARAYRDGLELLGACAEAATALEFGRILMPGLQRLMGCDEVSFVVVTMNGCRVVRTASYPTQMRQQPDAAEVWLTRTAEHPWLQHFSATHDPRAARLSDLMPRSTLVRSPFWADFYRPRHLRYAVMTTLSTAQGRLAGLALNRTLHDFSPLERDLLEQLRRPLGRLWERVDALPSETPAGVGVGLGAGVFSVGLGAGGLGAPATLTTAEVRVVRLVLEGMTNRAIGSTLGISDKAVEHHLTSVYQRLGVRSRTQLVLKVSASSPSTAGRSVAWSVPVKPGG